MNKKKLTDVIDADRSTQKKESIGSKIEWCTLEK